MVLHKYTHTHIYIYLSYILTRIFWNCHPCTPVFLSLPESTLGNVISASDCPAYVIISLRHSTPLTDFNSSFLFVFFIALLFLYRCCWLVESHDSWARHCGWSFWDELCSVMPMATWGTEGCLVNIFLQCLECEKLVNGLKYVKLST